MIDEIRTLNQNIDPDELADKILDLILITKHMGWDIRTEEYQKGDKAIKDFWEYYFKKCFIKIKRD